MTPAAQLNVHDLVATHPWLAPFVLIKVNAIYIWQGFYFFERWLFRALAAQEILRSFREDEAY